MSTENPVLLLTDNPVYPLKNKLLYPLPPWVCPLKFLKNLSLYYSAIAYLSGGPFENALLCT